jgi:hypothetical protein
MSRSRLIQVTISCRPFSRSVRASIRCFTRSSRYCAFAEGVRRLGGFSIRRSLGQSPKSIQAESSPNAWPQATQNRRVKSRIAQAFVDFRNEIAAEFNIDLAEPRLDLLSFELGGEGLDESLVFRAVGKKLSSGRRSAGPHYRDGSR